MRILFGLALVAAGTALSGCVSNTLDNLSNTTTGCNTTSVSVNCTTSSPTTTKPTSTPPTTTTTTGTTTTTAPTVNTGNTTTLTTGDTTIALEGSLAITQVGTPALSKLNDSPLNHVSTNQTANQQIWFDTKTPSNPNWPVSKVMTYSEYGTCQYDGGVDPANPGKCMAGTGGTGLGADYKLYRFYQKGGYDEELQIWTWGNSYATQYRDVTASGTDPQHQAWSFGGNYTSAANMPTSGIVNYTGQWGATAKTSNFVDTQSDWQTMSYNNSWRVNGTSALQANFGAGTFSGRLTPTDWQGNTKKGGFGNVNVANAISTDAACRALVAPCDPSTPAGAVTYENWMNYNAAFMNSQIVLAGVINVDPKNTSKPNQIVGTAVEDPNSGWITSANSPMFAGVFGTAGKEITGIFALDAVLTAPNDGKQPINNDRRAFMQMSGIFNGTAP